jgi:hypothetical protein
MDESGSPCRCAECGERFMGQERAEVVYIADIPGGPQPRVHYVIHQTCFDPDKHEVA